MYASNRQQKINDNDLFGTEEAIDKYLKDAAALNVETGNACSGMKNWRQPRISHSKFLRRVLAKSKVEVAGVKVHKYMF